MTTLAIHRIWGVYELLVTTPASLPVEVVAVPYGLVSSWPGPIQRAWAAVEARRG